MIIGSVPQTFFILMLLVLKRKWSHDISVLLLKLYFRNIEVARDKQKLMDGKCHASMQLVAW